MSGHNLTLGSGGQAPGWSASPVALGPFGSGGFLLLKFARNVDLPWNVGGAANDLRRQSIFGYGKITSAPGAGLWYVLYSKTGPNFVIDLSAGKLRALRFDPVTSTNNIATGATTLVNGQEFTFACTSGMNVGEFVKVYINGVLDASTAIVTAPIPRYLSQPDYIVGADNNGFTNSAGFPGLLGRMLVYDGELSASQVLGIHLEYQLSYPGLP